MSSIVTGTRQRLYQQSRKRTHPASGLARRMSDAIRTWRERARIRRQLAAMSERDLNDIGVGWSQVDFEINKPFWKK